MVKIVLDTNILLTSISSRSVHHWLFQLILSNKISIAFTNEILTEYEEIIAAHWNVSVAANVVFTLAELATTQKVDVHFKWNVIKNDPDDNKFVDCAFACNADFIVSNDTHFNIVKQVEFPKVIVVSLEEFEQILHAGGFL